MCYGILESPLLLWFFCILVINNALHLPCSRTALFQDFLDFLVSRHVGSTSKEDVDLFGRRGECKPQEYVSALQNYGGLVREVFQTGRFQFTEEAIRNIEGGELILQLNLLTQKTSIVKKRRQRYWEPIHVTIAEFLWYYHSSSCSSERFFTDSEKFLSTMKGGISVLGIFFIIGFAKGKLSSFRDSLMRLIYVTQPVLYPLIYEEYELINNHAVPSYCMSPEITLDIIKGSKLLLSKLVLMAWQPYMKVLFNAFLENHFRTVKLNFLPELEEDAVGFISIPISELTPETCCVPQVIVQSKDCVELRGLVVDTVSFLRPSTIKMMSDKDSKCAFPLLFFQELLAEDDFALKRIELVGVAITVEDLKVLLQTELMLNIKELCFLEVKEKEDTSSEEVKLTKNQFEVSMQNFTEQLLDTVMKAAANPIGNWNYGCYKDEVSNMLQGLIGSVVDDTQTEGRQENTGQLSGRPEDTNEKNERALGECSTFKYNPFFKILFEFIPMSNLVILEIQKLGLTQLDVQLLSENVSKCKTLQEFALAEDSNAELEIELALNHGICKDSRKWHRLEFENIHILIINNDDQSLQISRFKHRGTGLESETIQKLLRQIPLNSLDCEGECLLGISIDDGYCACNTLTELRINFERKFDELCPFLSSLNSLRIIRWIWRDGCFELDPHEAMPFFMEKSLELFEIEVPSLEAFLQAVRTLFTLAALSIEPAITTEENTSKEAARKSKFHSRLKFGSVKIALSNTREQLNKYSSNLVSIMDFIRYKSGDGLKIFLESFIDKDKIDETIRMVLEDYQQIDAKIMETDTTFSWVFMPYQS